MEWELDLRPIGTVRSCFPCKNGTPRQPTIASSARGHLKISKGIYNNPEHALQGLQEFSHVWLIFVFHKNKSGRFVKAKVSPPRLNGGKMGVFATRSPYRLNPIGLSLVKLESVDGDTLYFSGHDLVDGTPVLDIKPYISEYDCPSDRLRAPSPVHAVPAATEEDRVQAPAAEQTRPDDGTTGSSEPTHYPQGAGDWHDITKRLDKPPSSVGECPSGQPGACVKPGIEAGSGLLDRDSYPTEDRANTSMLDPSQPHPPASSQERVVTSDCLTYCPESNEDGSVQGVDSVAGAREEGGSTGPGVSAECGDTDPGASGEGGDTDPGNSVEEGGTWLSRVRPEPWTVSFTPWAESQLERFSASERAGAYRLRCLRDSHELRAALVQVLTAEPRSVYRRARGDQLLYHLALDTSHVTCWFDPARRCIEVLRLQPLTESPLAGAVTAGDG